MPTKNCIFDMGTPAFDRLVGAQSNELKGKELRDILGEKEGIFASEVIVELMRSGFWQGDIRRISANGEPKTESLLLASVPDPQGVVQAYVGIIRDFSELRSAKAILEYSTSHDSLTGLPNREYFYLAVQSLSRRTEDEGGILAICLLDLDDFKRINNDLSREAGDGLLRAVGRRLSEALRTGGSHRTERQR